jgi:hypothetical protein
MVMKKKKEEDEEEEEEEGKMRMGVRGWEGVVCSK